MQEIDKKEQIDKNQAKINQFLKDREIVLLDTHLEDIKIVLLWKEKNIVLWVIESDKIKDIKYDDYVFKKFFDADIQIQDKKYKVISILSTEDYEDKNFFTNEHIAMEVLKEFRWLGLITEMFNVKSKVDKIMWKSAEKIVWNIYQLLKNWYKVVWKIDENWNEIPFYWQEFIKRIVSLKIKNNQFDSRLDSTYIFYKQ